MKIQIRECSNPTCLFRYPRPVDNRFEDNRTKGNAASVNPTSVNATSVNASEACPLCQQDAELIIEYENDAGLPQPLQRPEIPHYECHVLLDNLRSLLNVGVIFRTADGAGVRHIHLAGTTPTPEHPRFAKTALGAEKVIPWSYRTNGLHIAQELKAHGARIIGLESGGTTRSLFEIREAWAQTTPLVLVMGNEVAGIDPMILALCDDVVHLPMAGVKQSLNVGVAFGIAVYQIQYGMA